ncbi:MAG TPA: hypothetical protein VKH81_20585 [Candidatus Angelobacter sp.]|nr:hypothetical protein [Candidatus Angelobacter sp.]
MRISKRHLFRLGLPVAALLLCMPQQALAKDDFGQIVKHIEVTYHVHRQHRFVMGMAGFVVKFWHFAGVKNFKGAIFENQPFVNAASDTRFDEVVRAAMNSGWQPMVQEWDRHTGERTYIYAQDLGKDLKMLVVSLESNEAVVIQVKVNPDKLQEFVREAGVGRHHDRALPHEETNPREETLEVAAAPASSWDGVCLLDEQEAALTEP